MTPRTSRRRLRGHHAPHAAPPWPWRHRPPRPSRRTADCTAPGRAPCSPPPAHLSADPRASAQGSARLAGGAPCARSPAAPPRRRGPSWGPCARARARWMRRGRCMCCSSSRARPPTGAPSACSSPRWPMSPTRCCAAASRGPCSCTTTGPSAAAPRRARPSTSPTPTTTARCATWRARRTCSMRWPFSAPRSCGMPCSSATRPPTCRARTRSRSGCQPRCASPSP